MLIVIAIIGILATIVIPRLVRARQAAHSASAVHSLRTMTTAQLIYYQKYNVYGTLAQLSPEGTLDPNLASGNKSFYFFVLALGPGAKTWSCNATPEEEPLDMKHYFVDETSVIRVNIGAPATAASEPIPK